MLISMIIPLHRKYSSCCRLFKSLKPIKRSLDFEILFILNSTNEINSSNEKYIKSLNFANIRMFFSKPCYASAARNIGIKSSNGKYLLFIDDDDFVSKKIFKNLITLVNDFPNIDVFFFQHIVFYSFFKKNKIKSNIEKNKILDRKYIEEHLIPSFLGFKNDVKLQPCVWLSLYKRDFLFQNQIFFDEKRSHGEDWKYLLFILKYGKSFYFVNRYFYYYVRVSNKNVSSSFNPNYFIDSVTDRYLCMKLFPQFEWNSKERISIHIDKFITSITYYKKYLKNDELIEKLSLIYDTYVYYGIGSLPCYEKRHQDLKETVLKGKDKFIKSFLN